MSHWSWTAYPNMRYDIVHQSECCNLKKQVNQNQKIRQEDSKTYEVTCERLPGFGLNVTQI